MFDKDKLFKELADDFIAAVQNYRNAKKESNIDKPVFMKEEEENQYYKERYNRMKTLNSSQDYIKITRVEYWEKILEAKIEVISRIGGFNMMQEFSDYLYNHQKDNELKLYNAFNYFADGIGGWIS